MQPRTGTSCLCFDNLFFLTFSNVRGCEKYVHVWSSVLFGETHINLGKSQSSIMRRSNSLHFRSTARRIKQWRYSPSTVRRPFYVRCSLSMQLATACFEIIEMQEWKLCSALFMNREYKFGTLESRRRERLSRKKVTFDGPSWKNDSLRILLKIIMRCVPTYVIAFLSFNPLYAALAPIV